MLWVNWLARGIGSHSCFCLHCLSSFVFPFGIQGYSYHCCHWESFIPYCLMYKVIHNDVMLYVLCSVKCHSALWAIVSPKLVRIPCIINNIIKRLWKRKYTVQNSRNNDLTRRIIVSSLWQLLKITDSTSYDILLST